MTMHRAMQVLRTGMKHHPENHKIILTLAKCLMDTCEQTEALELFEQAFTMSPDNHDYAGEYAAALRKTGNLGMAQIIYLWAYNDKQSMHYKNASVLKNLGEIHLKREEYEDAAICLGRAALINPQDTKNNKAYEKLVSQQDVSYSDDLWDDYMEDAQDLLDENAHFLPDAPEELPANAEAKVIRLKPYRS